MIGRRDSHRLPTGALLFRGTAPVDSPWKSLRGPVQRRRPTGAGEPGSAPPARIFSRANQAAASLRISRSSRNCRFSRRRRLPPVLRRVSPLRPADLPTTVSGCPQERVNSTSSPPRLIRAMFRCGAHGYAWEGQRCGRAASGAARRWPGCAGRRSHGAGRRRPVAIRAISLSSHAPQPNIALLTGEPVSQSGSRLRRRACPTEHCPFQSWRPALILPATRSFSPPRLRRFASSQSRRAPSRGLKRAMLHSSRTGARNDLHGVCGSSVPRNSSAPLGRRWETRRPVTGCAVRCCGRAAGYSSRTTRKPRESVGELPMLRALTRRSPGGVSNAPPRTTRDE